MNIQCIPVSPLSTNCYIAASGQACVIIDPGDEAARIVKVIENAALKPTAILLTHGHFDHAGAAASLKARWHIPLYVHRLDAPMLKSSAASHATRFGFTFTPVAADRLLEEGDTVSFGKETLCVLHTPGHTPGSVSYLCGTVLFCGDTLFRGTIGNFPPQAKADMQSSVRRLLALAPETHVYPGHEGATTIGKEKADNPYANVNWEWI